MDLREYAPVPKLVVKQTEIARPRFPVIDAHNHIGHDKERSFFRRPVGDLLAVLDEAGVAVMVDLDGMWGEDQLNAHLDRFKQMAPERFVMFGGVNWAAWPRCTVRTRSASSYDVPEAAQTIAAPVRHNGGVAPSGRGET